MGGLVLLLWIRVLLIF